jgi:hypothetical protein
MLWFLYSDETVWSGSSFAKGIKKIGDEYRFRNTTGWSDDDFRKCDIAVVFGCRDAQQRCIRSNKIHNVPTIVIDLGYVDRFDDYPDVEREHSYLQVNIGETLNIIPNKTCPSDRYDKLNLSYPGNRNNKDGYALFCGQMPGDATHPFKDAFSITNVVQEIQRRIPNIEVKYRAHPKVIINKVDMIAIEEDFAGARCILTYNSNSGHDALRYGLPIFCHQSAPYADLASSLFTLNQLEDRIKNPPFPSKNQWEHYFKRLAYAQWSFDELKNGECQQYIKNVLFS